MNWTLRALAFQAFAAVGAVVLAWWFGLPELAALAVAVWTTLALAALWLALRSRPASLTVSLHPAAVTRGDPARLQLRCWAPGTSTGTRTAPTRFRGSLGTAGTGVVACESLASGQSTFIEVDLPTPERGLIAVGPFIATVSDPLRLWRRTSAANGTAVLVVRPVAHVLATPIPGGGLLPSVGLESKGLRPGDDTDAELVGLRPYVRGDDLRRIHWRTSARRSEPHVVQVEPPALSASVAVVLDTTAPDCSGTAFERAVEACASLLMRAASDQRPARLVTTSGWDSERVAPSDVPGLLDVLAEVSLQSPADPVQANPVPAGIDSAVRQVSGHDVAVVVVTASAGSLPGVGAGTPQGAVAALVLTCASPRRNASHEHSTGRGATGDTTGGGGDGAATPDAPLVVRWDGTSGLSDAWARAVGTTTPPTSDRARVS